MQSALCTHTCPTNLLAQLEGGRHVFSPPLVPPLLGSTDHSFENNLTYKELYLMPTKMVLCTRSQNLCRPPQKFSSCAPVRMCNVYTMEALPSKVLYYLSLYALKHATVDKILDKQEGTIADISCR